MLTAISVYNCACVVIFSVLLPSDLEEIVISVSYTHLDVYKRQVTIGPNV